ncbi:MAG: biotin attachment protein [Desulfovibrionaceae bacterium]|jgi:acetyl/propionyl-CoA carboxylase alpha subunit|nr:biotin attachment protein [Desulfovibrionaceae bacterium]
MLDVTKLLEEIKASPYQEMEITAPQTGEVTFGGLAVGDKVVGPSGEFREKPGTTVATLTRERNPRPIRATQKGTVMEIFSDLEGTFVETGTPLVRIRHYLSKDEVQSAILRKALHLFRAPERAKYYFTPEVDTKIRAGGLESVHVREGMEILIMSRMKREAPLHYAGPDGVIYAVYFSPSQNVDAGAPLIGVCPPDQVALIQDVVVRVQTEWSEQD